MSARKIDDHAFWAGKGNDQSVFPMGAKMKQVAKEEGAGGLERYEDSEEAIRAQQQKCKSQAKAHPMKAGYRN